MLRQGRTIKTCWYNFVQLLCGMLLSFDNHKNELKLLENVGWSSKKFKFDNVCSQLRMRKTTLVFRSF